MRKMTFASIVTTMYAADSVLEYREPSNTIMGQKVPDLLSDVSLRYAAAKCCR